jgi:hypothetical protein
MDWMSAFLATLVPGLIVGVGVQNLYCHIFKHVPIHHVRRTKRYHTFLRIDGHGERVNVHQGNEAIFRVHPKHDTH